MNSHTFLAVAGMVAATSLTPGFVVEGGRRRQAMEGRRLYRPRLEKYPGQSKAYLIGAHCEEGRAMRERAR